MILDNINKKNLFLIN